VSKITGQSHNMLSAKRIIPEEMRSVFSMVPQLRATSYEAEPEARSSKLIKKGRASAEFGAPARPGVGEKSGYA
jgi:hypothetical protein